MSHHPHPRTTRRARRLALAAAALVAGSVVALPVAAQATTGPLGPLPVPGADPVTTVVKTVTGSAPSLPAAPAAPALPAAPAPALPAAPKPAVPAASSPTSSSTTSTASSPAPSGTSAEAHVVRGTLAGHEVVRAADSRAQVGRDGRGSGSTSLLAVGGTPVPGLSSSTGGTPTVDPLGPLTGPLCQGSGGAACVRVLHAESSTGRSGSVAWARSSGELLTLCLGGSDTTGRTCSGPVRVGVGTTSSSAQRDLRTGASSSSSSARLLSVCLTSSGAACDLALHVLQSSTSSSTGSSPSRGSSILGASSGSTTIVPDQTDPVDLSLLPGCDPQVVCLTGNQGSGSVIGGIVSSTQEALDLGVLPGVLGLDLVGTGSTATPGTTTGPATGTTGGTTSGGSDTGDGTGHGTGHGTGRHGRHAAGQRDLQAAGSHTDGLLPNTGGIPAGLLAAALAALGLGTVLVAGARRRPVTVVARIR